MTLEGLAIIYVVLMGLAIGSFLNVCVYRIPLGRGVGGRSACPQCKNQLLWYHNIPVFSYVFLLGQCGFCRQKISIEYPLVELATACLSLATFLHVGMDLGLYLIWFLFFICPLIVITVIDFHHQIIPDVISIPGIPIGFVVIAYLYWPNWMGALTFSFLGMLVGGGSLLLLAQIYYWIRKREGMGGGDIKLCGMLGAFLGWQAMVFIFFLSSVLALIYAMVIFSFQSVGDDQDKKQLVIPFGPFLSGGALICYFWGYEILDWYFNIAHLPYTAFEMLTPPLF